MGRRRCIDAAYRRGRALELRERGGEASEAYEQAARIRDRIAELESHRHEGPEAGASGS